MQEVELADPKAVGWGWGLGAVAGVAGKAETEAQDGLRSVIAF